MAEDAENQVQFDEAVDEGENEDDGAYNPYEHRPRRTLVSDISSYANLMKSAAGTGLFAMPYAFLNVGLLIGILGTILMGLIIAISLQLLMKTHYKMCAETRQPTMKYDQVVATTMTTGIMKGRISYEAVTLIVDIIMLMCYMGIGAVYVVFIAGIVQQCIDVEKTVGEAYYALILVPFFLLLNMVKGLHAIAPISIVGNLFLIIACIIGIVYAVEGRSSDDWLLIQPDVKLYPRFVGIVFFALCSPGLILAIEHSMENPYNYTRPCGVLNWSMGTLILIHIIVGSIGYCKYGNASLTNFIRNHHDLDAATLVALIMQALAIYFSYGLQCYIPITILYEDYVIKSIQDGYLRGTPYLWDIIVRISVTLITCIFAAAIPKLHLFTNFVGSFGIASLGFLFPIILFTLTNCDDFRTFSWKLFATIFIIVIGLISMICATVFSVLSVVQYMKH